MASAVPTSVLATPCAAENLLAEALTRSVKEVLAARNMGVVELAAQLDMMEVAADRLLRTERWEITTGIRVADALGLTVRVAVDGVADTP